MTASSGTPETAFPGRGPFKAPPPEILGQLEATRHQTGTEPFQPVLLYGMDLSRVDLGGEELASATIVDANLSGTRLDGASLRQAMAEGVLLRHASCCGTDFYKAGLEGADLTGVLAHGAYFGRANLLEARLDEGRFFHSDFTRASCHQASFVGADLSQCTFRGASLVGADLRGVSLGWADLSGAFLDSKTRLAGAKGVEDYVTATMIRFEGEEIVGEKARELLVELTRQPLEP